MQSEFRRVEDINRHRLSRVLYLNDIDDMKALLEAVGFTNFTHETDKAYGGQAMVIFAKK